MRKHKKLGEDIIGHMREKVDAMSDKYDLNYSFIATPAEGLSGRFIVWTARIWYYSRC